MVKDMPNIHHPNEMCESYNLSKQHINTFAKEADWRETELLKLLHTDICDPMNLESNGQNKYFLTLIDD